MKISYEDYLKARGLHLLASQAREQADAYSKALSDLLGLEHNHGHHVEDAVWGDRDFDEALKLEKITVLKADT
jgi:hypothetical protein